MKTSPYFLVTFTEANKVAQYIVDVRVVITLMTNNSNFINPTPALALVALHVDTLESDEERVARNIAGAVHDRNASLAVVRNDIHLLKAYISNVANANGPDKAKSIIESSGMKVGKKPSRTKSAVSARHGKIPRQVLLEAKALRRPVGYHWQMSADGETWTDLPETFKSTMVVDGLKPATVYYFRLRTVTKDGLSDWSTTVSIIVL